jgi:transcriptional regulator with XRE-family HTH domain
MTKHAGADLELLREIRRSRGKTQGDVGQALGYKSKSSYAMMELGTYAIDVGVANGIAEYLEMTDREVLAVFFPSYA